MLNTRGTVGWWVALKGLRASRESEFLTLQGPGGELTGLAGLTSSPCSWVGRCGAGMRRDPGPGVTNSLSVPDDPLCCSPQGHHIYHQVLHSPRAQSQPHCSSAQVSLTNWHPSAYGKWGWPVCLSRTQAGDSQAFSKAVRRQMEAHQMKIKCPCLDFADCNQEWVTDTEK